MIHKQLRQLLYMLPSRPGGPHAGCPKKGKKKGFMLALISALQAHLLCSLFPKTLKPQSVDSIWSYISHGFCFHPVSLAVFFPSLQTHRFRFVVPLPLSFFQTLMIFLYTGINQGNDPQWQKLNYTRGSLVPSAWQRQFSMELRGDLASGSTVWSEENCDREQRETETWKSAQLIENERLRLRNVLPKQLRFQDKWLSNAGNRACDNSKTNAAQFVKRITCSPVNSSVSTEKMHRCVIVCF